MKIIFTGSSSFTGYWFIKTLAEAGHSVIATFRGNPEIYEGVRKQRTAALIDMVPCFFDCSFGSSAFLNLLDKEEKIDLICHHDACVTDYKSPDFDVTAALAHNTHNITQVLNAVRQRLCSHLLLTGSIFEPGEGEGSDGLPAFSPYGLSKGLTAEMFRFYTGREKMIMGKFVISNTFGPYEESRFTSYLIKTWFEGKTPLVMTPDYIRDNIHVSLLARAYVRFAEKLIRSDKYQTMHPSGYCEPQGSFATRFATELSGRLALNCPLEFARQEDFPEPKVRINTDPVANLFPDWNEKKAWDELARYYKNEYQHLRVSQKSNARGQ